MVVLLTPPLPAALAVVLVTGPQAVPIVERHFLSRSRRMLADVTPAEIVLGEWSDGETLVVCRTAANQMELHPHGGPAAVTRIIEQLIASGCRQLDASDWRRHHPPKSLEAAAEAALCEATTERTLAILLDQANGVLKAEFSRIAALLARADLTASAAALDTLLARAEVGLHLTTPWKIAVIGPPNVGKSSLINALLGYRRAIVADQPGTTRDLVTASTAFDGWPVLLIDTAGLHDTHDPIELAGIDLVTLAATNVDLIVRVSDATRTRPDPGPTPPFSQVAHIEVRNKIDLVAPSPAMPRDVLGTSATLGSGVPELIRAMVDRLVPAPPPAAAPVPFTAQIVDTLHAARQNVLACQPSSARQVLLESIAD